MALPRFVVLRYLNEGSFVGLVNSNDKSNGSVKASLDDEYRVNSIGVKFELEAATKAGKGMIHIRSCKNNKYWARSNESPYITVSATKAEEDTSKEWCTLFQVERAEEGKVRLKHVRTGNYACVWTPGPSSVFDRCILASYKVHDHQSCDIFALKDWESYLILPRYVAFKGDNGQYLQVAYAAHPYMQVQGGTDIGSGQIAQEVFYTNDGSLRFRPTLTGKFWRLSPCWIWADSTDRVGNDRDTLFAGYKVNDRTVAIKCLANGRFLSRLTADGKTNCLNANSSDIVDWCKLKVEEPVMTREIYGIEYNLDDARIYGESVIAVGKTTAVNNLPTDGTIQVKISYQDFNSTNWKVNGSLKLSVKAEFTAGVPVIGSSKIEVGGEVQVGEEWGKTTSSTTTVKSTYGVSVPAMSSVVITLLATKGFCDVPFSFTQRDVLYNGKSIITQVEGGTFVGCNYYNFYIKSFPAKPVPSKK